MSTEIELWNEAVINLISTKNIKIIFFEFQRIRMENDTKRNEITEIHTTLFDCYTIFQTCPTFTRFPTNKIFLSSSNERYHIPGISHWQPSEKFIMVASINRSGCLGNGDTLEENNDTTSLPLGDIGNAFKVCFSCTLFVVCSHFWMKINL